MKPLIIKRLKHEQPVSISDIDACLETETPEIPVALINWAEHPYCPKVSVRIGHFQTVLWLKFHVVEDRIRALETRTHGEVYKDSCVEFFISFDRTNYYNFEFNCIGTPHLAYGPGREDRKFVPLPLMEHMAIHASLGPQPFEEKSGTFDWTLTVRVPVACLAFDKMTSLSGLQASANFYKTGSGLSVPHYLSWKPISTPHPDFHRPEFFGDVTFE